MEKSLRHDVEQILPEHPINGLDVDGTLVDPAVIQHQVDNEVRRSQIQLRHALQYGHLGSLGVSAARRLRHASHPFARK